MLFSMLWMIMMSMVPLRRSLALMQNIAIAFRTGVLGSSVFCSFQSISVWFDGAMAFPAVKVDAVAGCMTAVAGAITAVAGEMTAVAGKMTAVLVGCRASRRRLDFQRLHLHRLRLCCPLPHRRLRDRGRWT